MNGGFNLNKFPYSFDNKRYHTLYYHNMQIFGERVYKAPINAGFTCPNIDGTKGIGGCIYCDGGSGYFTDEKEISVKEQLSHQIFLIHQKHPNAKINAYFQSYSNTYDSAKVLRSRIEPVLDFEDVVSVSIATRCDCLKDDALIFLKELSDRTSLTVELGLQTVHEKTAELINRGHSYSEFLQGYYSLKDLGIRTVVHIINGLPRENEEMMTETAEKLGQLYPDGIKIHLLHIIKGTALEAMFRRGEYTPLEKDEYVDITVKQLEVIPAETVIERLTGDGDKSKLISPLWSRDKISVLGAIDKLQAKRDSYQGKMFKK